MDNQEEKQKAWDIEEQKREVELMHIRELSGKKKDRKKPFTHLTPKKKKRK